MDPNISMGAGRENTKKIIKKLNFEEVKFEQKKATSKYYAKDQEEEIFAKYKGKWFEIGDIGMYSPISLANFGIEYPVFNAGFGIERLIMILEEYDDIRELMFPQFYLKSDFSDKKIAKSIYLEKKPETKKGEEIANAIYKTAKKYKNKIGPVEFIAWQGKINDKKIIVKIIETEKGKNLIGPAGFNKISVKDKNIIGSSNFVKTSSDKLEKQGLDTEFDYMKAIAAKIAYEIENKKNIFTYQVKIVRSLNDINLNIPKPIKNYLKAEHKKIDIRGPVFVTIKVKFEN